MSNPTARPVVFIHGLWMHSSSWGAWLDAFDRAGYQTFAPGWPGDAESADATRKNADALNNRGIAEVTEHYAEFIAGLPMPPVVVGHSFGGLIAQKLLGSGITAGCVAIAPAQFRGVLTLPLAQIQSVLPILSKPWLRGKTWSHTPASYHRTFASGIPREESDKLLATYGIPAPVLPLFQGGLANFTPNSEASVDTKRERGPLLMLAGGRDRLVPEATVRSEYKIQRKNAGVTELVVFPDRGHSMPADHGWREIADTALDFLQKQNLPAQPTA